MTNPSAIGADDDPDDEGGSASSEMIGFLFWLSRLATEKPPSATPGAAPVLESPRTFGNFRLESLLGSGAYGAVFLATDLELQRRVALKVAWPATLMDAETCRRFVEEPRTVAALKHPGIVEVYGSGNVEMARFISLELVEGPTLADWLKAQEHVAIRSAAIIMQSVAEAVEYAHQCGVIHRDLKPRNILLRPIAVENGSLPFRPVVTDFGLASRPHLTEASAATATYAVLGTESYMSPEQAAGRSAEVGPESDVFSLGVILYEMLAGRRPFHGESAEQIRERIQLDDPFPIRPWRKSVPKDIDTIIFKCLEKAPAKRYVSAGELAKDLRRFLDHEPILARPISARQRAWRFARRRPRAVAMAALGVFAALLVSALVGALIEERQSSARELALAQQAASQAAGMERQHQYATTLRFAARAHAKGNRTETLKYLRECSELAVPPVHLGLEWRLLTAMTNGVDRVLRGNFGGIRAVRFSPDGQLLICGGADNRLIFWDTATWKPRRSVFNSGRAIKAAEFSADGALLAVGGENGRVVVHRLADGSIVFDEKIVKGRVFSIAWIGNSHRCGVGGEDGILSVIDVDAKEVRASQPIEPSKETRLRDPVHKNEIGAIVFVPSRGLFAIVKTPAEVAWVDPETLKVVDLWQDELMREGVGAVCHFNRGTDYLAFATANRIVIRSALDGSLAMSIPIDSLVEEIKFNPSDSTLIAACRNGSVQSWSLRSLPKNTPESPRILPGHSGRAYTLDVSPSQQWIASGGKDGTIRLWGNPAAGAVSEMRIDHRPLVVRSSPCGRWFGLLEGPEGRQNFISIFDYATRRKVWSSEPEAETREAHDGGSIRRGDLAFCASGEEVAELKEDGSVVVYSCSDGKRIADFPAHDPAATALSYSPDSRAIVVWGSMTDVAVRRDDGTVSATWGKTNHLLHCTADSQGDLWIEARASHRCALKRSPTDQPYRVLGPIDDRFQVVAVSADGSLFAGGGVSSIVHLWELNKNEAPDRLIGHDGRLVDLAFSRDGCTLFSRATDGTLRLWHLATKSEVVAFGSESNPVLCYCLHPLEKALILGVQHGQTFGLQCFELPTESPVVTGPLGDISAKSR